MLGSILIVDAIATNRIVLKVKLATAFYEVVQAESMAQALDLIAGQPPKLILCALNLPDGGAARLATKLHQDPRLEAPPIIAVAASPDAQDRLEALQHGVQEVLCKQVDDTLLLGRVRSAIRRHDASAEWQVREDTSRALGLSEPKEHFAPRGHCVLVGADAPRLRAWAADLRPVLRAKLTLAPSAAVMRSAAQESEADVFVLVLPAATNAALNQLRLIAELRAHAATRHAGVLVLQTDPDPVIGAQALDLGADDLMSNGFDAAELALRFRTLLRAKRRHARLRASVRSGLQAAVFDPLTGLYNRRYAMPHLTHLAESARKNGTPFAVLAADLDHFKRVNDSFGHASGDAVLVEVAERLRASLRSNDLIARIGGEEFMIAMAVTSVTEARRAAMRICDAISSRRFSIPGNDTPIPLTISIGMAFTDPRMPSDQQDAADAERETGETLLARADKALYAAKGKGRNRVTLGRPAA